MDRFASSAQGDEAFFSAKKLKAEGEVKKSIGLLLESIPAMSSSSPRGA